ncbi:hypothetical protein DFP72DRAFT_516082 [Ephemerocybe angulata]|uniref:Uncharacterized protein n=1 Tax=Ephemerocybe angulata TaxID=980116 RepID=A0A8H6HNC4_9AGAR|nr:hypothetical protein DFP72DRAFT_516082 [Tulosesus angulatus]
MRFTSLAIAMLPIGGSLAAICTTSSSSPSVSDGNSLAQALIGGGFKNLRQTSGDGACTSIGSFGSARANLCGRAGLIISSDSAGRLLSSVVADCNSGGKAAGQSLIDNIGRVELVYI